MKLEGFYPFLPQIEQNRIAQQWYKLNVTSLDVAQCVVGVMYAVLNLKNYQDFARKFPSLFQFHS